MFKRYINFTNRNRPIRISCKKKYHTEPETRGNDGIKDLKKINI